MARRARRGKAPRRKSEARSALAAARPRGPGGRFLTKAEIEALEVQDDEGLDEGVGEADVEVIVSVGSGPESEPESEPMTSPSRSVVDEELARLRHAPVDTFTSGTSGDHSMLERSMKRHERRLRRG